MSVIALKVQKRTFSTAGTTLFTHQLKFVFSLLSQLEGSVSGRIFDGIFNNSGDLYAHLTISQLMH